MADTQLDATLSASEPISGNLSANEGISASLAPDEEVSGMLEVKRTRVVATMLAELEDVELADLQDDDILVYDSLDGKWHNEEQTAGGGTWGTITGTLSDQTDLQGALDGKYDVGDTPETDIQDGDYFPFYDNSASAKKNSLWSNIKAKLNEIFFTRSENNILGAKNFVTFKNCADRLNTVHEFTLTGIRIYSTANGTYRGSYIYLDNYPRNVALKLTTDIVVVSGRAIIGVYGSDDNTTWTEVALDPSTTVNKSVELNIPSSSYAYYRININCTLSTSEAGDATFNNLMLRLATDTDDTFEPYAMTNKALTDKYNGLAEVATSGDYADLTGTPTLATVATSGSYSDLTGTPTLGSAAEKNVPSSGDAGQTEVVLGSDTRLTDARTPTSHTHTTSEITDFPTLATVATSGSYNDLEDTPTIPDELADLSDDATHRLVTDTEKSTWNNKCDNSVVAPVENGATASQAYAVGAHFIRDGAYCTAKTAIASGATFTLNTNYTAGTLADMTAILTGTTAANGGNVQIDYPTGFTQDNCIIIGLMLYSGATVGWRSFGHISTSNSVTAELGASKVAVSTRDAGGASLPFKLLLYRYV